MYLGTRTVSILQFSWGSRSHSSLGMFCSSCLVSVLQACTQHWVGWDETLHYMLQESGRILSGVNKISL